MASIPLHTVVVARVLVILEVAQDARLHCNVEVIGLVGPHGHETCAHDKAVHLATHRAVHVGNLVGVEVVASREAEVPVLGGPDVSIEAQVVGKLALVLHLVVVESPISIVY